MEKIRHLYASVLSASLLLFVSSVCFAQQVEFSSALNPVGSGARATGMGGAFISVADDATAASWNPAGLIHLEKPELSFVGAYFGRSQEYHSEVHPEIGTINSNDLTGLNYASAAYPFVLLGRNMVISLNYQRLYEMNKKVVFNLTTDIASKGYINDRIDFRQKGYLYALSPAYAVQVVPQLYLGVTLNFWKDLFGRNGWENTFISSGSGRFAGHDFQENVVWKNRLSFSGFNAHLGLLWNISEKLTLGGVYKTPFKARLRKETFFSSSQDWTDISKHFESATASTESLTMKMPPSYGLGLSYRHSDAWLVAFDLYHTQWSRFSIIDAKGNEINPLDGRLLSEGRLENTTQVRFGTEYLFIKDRYVIPLRAGLFYDPEPSKNKTDKFYGISFGSGYATQKFSLDASYQYRFGNNTTGDIPSVEGSRADIKQHTAMLSLIWYLK